MSFAFNLHNNFFLFLLKIILVVELMEKGDLRKNLLEMRPE